MPAPTRNRLPDPIPSLQDFEGIVNTRRSKDIGYGGLTVGRNVEITNTKKLVRRDGYSRLLSGPYSAVYGTQTQQYMYAVRDGALVRVAFDGTETVLASSNLDGLYSWDEDPANNTYYTSSQGSSGIVLSDGMTHLPLVLPTPSVLSVAVVTTAPWTVTPFNLGKTYTGNVMQLFATYLYADGRETAPSEIVTLPVAPEVQLLQAVVPLQPNATTLVYATAPGGSTYYLVAQATTPSFTFRVDQLTQQYTGPDYPYMTALDSFPPDAYLLQHHGGRLYAATYDPISRLGAIYKSLPLQYHLFDREHDFIMTSGPPLLMLDCKGGVLIATDSNIYFEPDDGPFQQLTNYGVPPGICGDVTQDGLAVFWTLRGVAKAMPYELVTEQRFSGDPGQFNAGKIFYDRGYAKFVASIVAGAPTFNQWSSR